MIVRRLLGLEDALSMGICGPTHDWRSWNFDLDPGEGVRWPQVQKVAELTRVMLGEFILHFQHFRDIRVQHTGTLTAAEDEEVERPRMITGFR